MLSSQLGRVFGQSNYSKVAAELYAGVFTKLLGINLEKISFHPPG